MAGLSADCWFFWRRGPESNRRIKVLQTSPLPLGYRALNLFTVARSSRKIQRGAPAIRYRLTHVQSLHFVTLT